MDNCFSCSFIRRENYGTCPNLLSCAFKMLQANFSTSHTRPSQILILLVSFDCLFVGVGSSIFIFLCTSSHHFSSPFFSFYCGCFQHFFGFCFEGFFAHVCALWVISLQVFSDQFIN